MASRCANGSAWPVVPSDSGESKVETSEDVCTKDPGSPSFRRPAIEARLRLIPAHGFPPVHF